MYRINQKRTSTLLHNRTVLVAIFLLATSIVVAVLIVVATSMDGDKKQSTSYDKARQDKARPSPAAGAYANAVEQKALTELADFGSWLKKNDAKGFVGEFGWPRTKDTDQWSAVGAAWLKEAEVYDLWATGWAAGSWWGDYQLAMYGSDGRTYELQEAYAQAAIFRQFATTNSFGDRRGINLAGMEFGEEKLTNTTPGNPGVDYFYEPTESFAYLHKQGITTVRLPFRWERIQPVLGGELKQSEIKTITDMLDAAAKNDIKVILDLHNYGAYKTSAGSLLLGDTLSHGQFADVWVRLSGTFKDHKALLGYGIMNEPHDLPRGQYATPAQNWEAASQHVVERLRAAGDDTLIFVAGYDWSSLARWKDNHPQAWIADTAKNIRYEAHHYWDADGSGTYKLSFDDEQKRIEN